MAQEPSAPPRKCGQTYMVEDGELWGREVKGETERQPQLRPQKNTAKAQALQQVKGIFPFLAISCSFPPRQERQSPSHKLDPVPSKGGDLSPAAEPSAEGWRDAVFAGAESQGCSWQWHPSSGYGSGRHTVSIASEGRVCLYLPPLPHGSPLSILPWPGYSWHTGKCEALGIGAQRLFRACQH